MRSPRARSGSLLRGRRGRRAGQPAAMDGAFRNDLSGSILSLLRVWIGVAPTTSRDRRVVTAVGASRILVQIGRDAREHRRYIAADCFHAADDDHRDERSQKGIFNSSRAGLVRPKLEKAPHLLSSRLPPGG